MRDVRMNLGPLKRLKTMVKVGLSVHAGPMNDMFRQWAARYSSFTRLRFKRYSRGGGDWPGLAESTKRGRQKARKGAKRDVSGRYAKKGGRVFSILYNLGFILGALTIGAPGNETKWITNGIRFGFGGPARHPGEKASIADIARFHDQGEGGNPQRRIIVMPDMRTKEGMKRDAQRCVRRMGKQAGGGL